MLESVLNCVAFTVLGVSLFFSLCANSEEELFG